ncbi:MAG: hypothetical protein QNJ97_27305 [Myxococcota bacterium]|nr:hypothetical protein [Myxococcota bacterium]
MKYGTRLILVALVALTAVIIIAVVYYGLAATLETETAEGLNTALRLLGIVTALYAVNFVVAWRFASSWPIGMVRMLAWGVIAYLYLSGIVDILANDRSLIPEIIGLAEPRDGLSIAVLRGRLAAGVVGLIMACVAIGVGFEEKGS